MNDKESLNTLDVAVVDFGRKRVAQIADGLQQLNRSLRCILELPNVRPIKDAFVKEVITTRVVNRALVKATVQKTMVINANSFVSEGTATNLGHRNAPVIVVSDRGSYRISGGTVSRRKAEVRAE